MIYNDNALETFNKEEGELLKYFLDEMFFDDQRLNEFFKNYNKHNVGGGDLDDYSKQPLSKLYEHKTPLCVEFIVRPQCTEKCEYCYLQKYTQELNHNIDTHDNQKILNNLEHFMDYCFHKKRTLVRRIELFAGDLFYDNLFFDIMEILYKYYEEAYENDAYLFDKEKADYNTGLFEIIIPTNITVIKNDEKVEKIKEWYYKFAKINIQLGLSFSTDGPFNIDTREQHAVKDAEELNELYDKLLDLIVELGAGCHPVIAPNAIDKWIENYDWWLDFMHKANEKSAYYGHGYGFQPPMLEVRDSNWTLEKIEQYVQFLKHVVDKRLELCNNDIDELAYHLFKGDGENNTLPRLNQYDVIFPGLSQRRLTCSLQNLIHIRLADMALVPCHRLSYDTLIGGWFEQNEDGELTGNIIPHNVSSLIAIKTMNPDIAPRCIVCPIKNFCLKGCLGSQYETNGEYLQPIESVCNLFFAKWNFLIDYWYNLGVLQSAKNQHLLEDGMGLEFLHMCNPILVNRGYQPL